MLVYGRWRNCSKPGLVSQTVVKKAVKTPLAMLNAYYTSR